jgi:hypothetical protein
MFQSQSDGANLTEKAADRCRLFWCAYSLAAALKERTHDPGQDRAATGTAKSAAEQAAHSAGCAASCNIRAAAEQCPEQLTARHAAYCTAEDFGQLAHRCLFEGSADRLSADHTGDDLYEDW